MNFNIFTQDLGSSTVFQPKVTYRVSLHGWKNCSWFWNLECSRYLQHKICQKVLLRDDSKFFHSTFSAPKRTNAMQIFYSIDRKIKEEIELDFFKILVRSLFLYLLYQLRMKIRDQVDQNYFQESLTNIWRIFWTTLLSFGFKHF